MHKIVKIQFDISDEADNGSNYSIHRKSARVFNSD